MRIGIITPARRGSRSGNRITAERWARILKALGHRTRIDEQYRGEPFDLLVALHARRSYPAVHRFHRQHPERPLIVALTGTDLYRDLPRSRRAQESVRLSTRLIVLQPKAIEALPAQSQTKARVIFQSVAKGPWPRPATRRSPGFQVAMLGHLRPVKDPMRVALAARLLPASSRVRIVHLGRAMTRAMADRVRAEMRRNPRYRWLGERPRPAALATLAASDLVVLPSKLEGGANVLGEAIVAGVPVLASRIAGSVGILGADYAGYFRVGDTRELARLLARAENDPAFLAQLRRQCRSRASLFKPEREKTAWARLLREVGGPQGTIQASP
jgi:putative glycosyltransferase (TIGR04348 family)